LEDLRTAEAERDAALASLTEAREQTARLAPTLAETRQKLLDVLNAWEAEREQTARMRPVVEAARDFEEFWRGRPELESVAGRRWSVLYGALHALDAGAAAGGEGATW